MLGKLCITPKENTEWVETVDAGWNVLVGADKEKIVDVVNHLLNHLYLRIQNCF